MREILTMSFALGCLGVAIVCALAAVIAFHDAGDAEAKSQAWASDARLWCQRAFDAGWSPRIEDPHRVLREIFRPMGARPVEDRLSLSTEQDVAALRAWRARRAILSSDHRTRHFAEGDVPSAWATEVMHLCVGPLEVEGE